MEAKRWKRIKSIFDIAVELAPDDREGFLDGACASPSLRMEVESLIAADRASGSVLERGASRMRDRLFPSSVSVSEDPSSAASDSMAGKWLGDYQVLSRADQGGMGYIYLALRRGESPGRVYAIKLLKRSMQNQVERFLKERNILAELDHPNIARFVDGGSAPDGRPYFVMEHIRGKPIDEYCDLHRVSLKQRIRIFLRLCSAVSCIHQSRIVHRDIKPSNVLVTEDGEPKLLDFGIAKLLNPDMSPNSLTRRGMRMMTPEYTSPEQIRGEPSTIATDLYSLGVVLYKLLTGHRPYPIPGIELHDFLRAVCELEATAPSKAILLEETTELYDGSRIDLDPERVSRDRKTTPEKLRKELADGLDGICLRTLRKNPDERYRSVEELTEALNRHLPT